MNIFGCAILAVFLGTATSSWAQTEQRLALIEERLERLRAEVEDLQFRNRRMQEQLDDLQAQVNHLRKTITEADWAKLDSQIRALDAARERDKQIILDTLAKELAALSASRPAAGGIEHVVARGETLSAIAAKYGVTTEAIVRANNLNNPHAIQVGQKLIIPK